MKCIIFFLLEFELLIEDIDKFEFDFLYFDLFFKDG